MILAFLCAVARAALRPIKRPPVLLATVAPCEQDAELKRVLANVELKVDALTGDSKVREAVAA
jgi:hypothetical protein